jgi:hypothetical protein
MIGSSIPFIGVDGQYHTQEWSTRTNGVITGFGDKKEVTGDMEFIE